MMCACTPCSSIVLRLAWLLSTLHFGHVLHAFAPSVTYSCVFTH